VNERERRKKENIGARPIIPLIKDTLNFDLKGGTGFFPRAVAMWVLTLEVRSLCFSNVLYIAHNTHGMGKTFIPYTW
jgi:hypothetical protein